MSSKPTATAAPDRPPACPRCGKSKHARPSGERNWFCAECRVEFEPTDDGDYSDRSPSARIERQERNRKLWPRRK